MQNTAGLCYFAPRVNKVRFLFQVIYFVIHQTGVCLCAAAPRDKYTSLILTELKNSFRYQMSGSLNIPT